MGYPRPPCQDAHSQPWAPCLFLGSLGLAYLPLEVGSGLPRSQPQPAPPLPALRSGSEVYTRVCRRQALLQRKLGPQGGDQARRNSTLPSNRHLATASPASEVIPGPGPTEGLTWPGEGNRSCPGEVLPPCLGPLLPASPDWAWQSCCLSDRK